MSAVNAFTVGLSYLKGPHEATKPAAPPSPDACSRKEKWGWFIITQNASVQLKIVDMIIELEDAAYGPESVYYQDREQNGIAVSFAMVEELMRTETDFVTLYKVSKNVRWSIAMMYSPGDLGKYFGKRFQDTHRDTRLMCR